MLKEMDLYTQIAIYVVMAGGILWGLYGLFNINILTTIFGGLGRLLDILIGVAAGWLCYKVYLEKFAKPSV